MIFVSLFSFMEQLLKPHQFKCVSHLTYSQAERMKLKFAGRNRDPLDVQMALEKNPGFGQQLAGKRKNAYVYHINIFP